MTRSLKTHALTGLAALAAAMPLASCGSSQGPQEATNIEYRTPDGSFEQLPAGGLLLPTPKWFAGKAQLRSDADANIEPVGDTVVAYMDAGEQRITNLAYIGSEASRTIADADGRPILNEAASERVDVGSGESYDAVSVGIDPNASDARLSPSELEDLLAETVGDAYAGENRFYAVLGKDESGAYNDFHAYGSIADPEGVRAAIADLEDCASGTLGLTRARVMQGDFDEPGTMVYGAVVEAYDADESCVAQLLVGSGEELSPVALRASELGYTLAPNAAAATYLDE